MRLAFLGIILMVCIGPIHAQKQLDLQAYFPYQIGDSIQYTNLITEQELAFKYLELVSFRKDTVVKTLQSNKLQYEKWNKTGLEVYLLKNTNGEQLIFTTPLLLFPAQLDKTNTHTQTITYNLFQENKKTGTGSLHYELKWESQLTAKTPARNFVDCQVFLQTFHWKYPNKEIIIEQKSWYAKGYGMVKSIRKEETITSQKKEKRTQALILKKAKIGAEILGK